MSACQPDTINPATKLNPHPKMRYELTLKINGAPGPFESILGVMFYEVTNKDCVPETGAPMNPLRLAPQANPQIVFEKVADNVYRGIVYGDYFKDENYFGLGVCHWSLTGLAARLKIGKNTLVPYMSPEQLFSQQPVVAYFTQLSYTMNDGAEVSISGEAQRTNFSPDRQSTLFSVTLSSREIGP